MDPQNEYENFDLLIFYSRFTDAVAKFAYDGGKKGNRSSFRFPKKSYIIYESIMEFPPPSPGN